MLVTVEAILKVCVGSNNDSSHLMRRYQELSGLVRRRNCSLLCGNLTRPNQLCTRDSSNRCSTLSLQLLLQQCLPCSSVPLFLCHLRWNSAQPQHTTTHRPTRATNRAEARLRHRLPHRNSGQSSQHPFVHTSSSPSHHHASTLPPLFSSLLASPALHRAPCVAASDAAGAAVAAMSSPCGGCAAAASCALARPG